MCRLYLQDTDDRFVFCQTYLLQAFDFLFMKRILKNVATACILAATANFFSCSHEEPKIVTPSATDEGNHKVINVDVAEYYGEEDARTSAATPKVRVRTLTSYLCRLEGADGRVFFDLRRASDRQRIARSHSVDIESFPVIDYPFDPDASPQYIQLNFNLDIELTSGEKYLLQMNCTDGSDLEDENNLAPNESIYWWYADPGPYSGCRAVTEYGENTSWDMAFRVKSQSYGTAYYDVEQKQKDGVALINWIEVPGFYLQEFIPTYRNYCGNFRELDITNFSYQKTNEQFKFSFKIKNESDEILNLDNLEIKIPVTIVNAPGNAIMTFKKKLGFLEPGAYTSKVEISFSSGGLNDFAGYVDLRDLKPAEESEPCNHRIDGL